MEKIKSFLAAGALLASVLAPSTGFANAAALSDAKARLACGAGTAIGADVRPDGSIKVTCQSPGRAGAPAGGLSGPGIGGLAVLVGLCLILCGGDDVTVATREMSYDE